MEDLIAKSFTLAFVQFLQLLESWRILSDQSTFLQERDLVDQIGITCKVLDIAEQGGAGNTS